MPENFETDLHQRLSDFVKTDDLQQQTSYLYSLDDLVYKAMKNCKGIHPLNSWYKEQPVFTEDN